jgi:hypothetical protein
MKRYSDDWTGNPRQKRELPLMKVFKSANSGVREMVTASGQINANLHTLVHKVVVRGPKVQGEKAPAKEKDVAKEEKAKGKESREGLATETIKEQR